MAAHGSSPAGALRRERAIVLALCAVAALRILVHVAALPLFHNIDELAHFDLVAKYARGHDVLRGSDRYDAASARVRVLYGSPEYANAPGPRGTRPPLFAQPTSVAQRALRQHTPSLQGPNHEIHAPPLYYATAALWLRLGHALGLGEAGAAYWLRFLNAGIYALVVLCAYLYARRLHPDRLELRLGVPLLVAFVPQDVFYGINSDVLSPLVAGLALLGMAGWLRERGPSARLGIATGSCVALALLVKLSNAWLLGVMLGWAAIRALRPPRAGVLLAVAAALLPLLAWMLRNQWLLGDPTGNAEKLALLGWTTRPLALIPEHPIFHPVHAGNWLQNLLAVYWRGELVWHGAILQSAPADAFYAFSSLFFVGLGAVAGALGSERARSAAALHFACCALAVALLGTLSVAFQYGETSSPSRAFPFFAAGRLISGTLLPFACLYVSGIALLLRPLVRVSPRIPAWGTLAVVALFALGITIHEARLNAPIFESPYSGRHVPWWSDGPGLR